MIWSEKEDTFGMERAVPWVTETGFRVNQIMTETVLSWGAVAVTTDDGLIDHVGKTMPLFVKKIGVRSKESI